MLNRPNGEGLPQEVELDGRTYQLQEDGEWFDVSVADRMVRVEDERLATELDFALVLEWCRNRPRTHGFLLPDIEGMS